LQRHTHAGQHTGCKHPSHRQCTHTVHTRILCHAHTSTHPTQQQQIKLPVVCCSWQPCHARSRPRHGSHSDSQGMQVGANSTSSRVRLCNQRAGAACHTHGQGVHAGFAGTRPPSLGASLRALHYITSQAPHLLIAARRARQLPGLTPLDSTRRTSRVACSRTNTTGRRPSRLRDCLSVCGPRARARACMRIAARPTPRPRPRSLAS
jgi:hypothetical protein